MKLIKKAIGTTLLSLACTTLFASDYTYVGSFTTVGDAYSSDGTYLGDFGTWWTNNPPVYSGLEAAALIFGQGKTYAISTVADQASPNGLAWYDGWGDPNHVFVASYKLDSTGLGYNGCEIAGTSCQSSAFSALIKDHFMTSSTNYVYAASVPEPETYAMLLAGLSIVAGIARRKN